MTESAKTVKFLKDYQPPEFKVDYLKLEFQLHETATQVKAVMQITKLHQDAILKLYGSKLLLKEICIDEKTLMESEYVLDEETLTVPKTPTNFILLITVQINPEANTALTGLFLSNGNFCTQCEPEGFRCITYFFDRPDYLTKFSTKIIADKTKYPILLSNGNLISKGSLKDNLHFVEWEDPFYKPSYLFALVAGDLDVIEDYFITGSGRKVTLRIYVDKGNQDKANYAMFALKDAMRWDEKNYNREYDLDIFMIVAVSDFNMGAMENKGLNIFNAKYILASEETATDDDYESISTVVAHEYFHNWSGNRVTCRDWFQLSLKEGFTVFREQSYTADITSAGVKRINDAKILRAFQYSEDAGPMSHPVQPGSYIEIDNFYTHTVYEKGAEVIRMIKTLIGDVAFFRGANLYFAENDGKAVTINEFCAAMEKASGIDLTQFKLWYKQSGTPKIKVRASYEEEKDLVSLGFEQEVPDTADMKNKKPMHVPIKIALYSSDGTQMHSELLQITKKNDEFTFKNIKSKPIVSLLNDFSAPVEIEYPYNDDELCFLMKYDNDPFSRYDANQFFVRRLFCSEQAALQLPQEFFISLRENLKNGVEDKSFLAELLLLPSEKYLLSFCKPINISEKHKLYQSYEKQIAIALYEDFWQCYKNNEPAQSMTKSDRAARKLKNICLYYLVNAGTKDAISLAYNQYNHTSNMTDRMASFKALIKSKNMYTQEVISDFHERFQHDVLVLDKWFSAQAMIDDSETLTNIQKLMDHKAFSIKNPNKVRALIGTFSTFNLGQFHRADGKGYTLLTDIVLQLNKLNPSIAARLLEPLTHWNDFIEPNKTLMKDQLKTISNKKDLSSDVYEVVMKSLEIP